MRRLALVVVLTACASERGERAAPAASSPATIPPEVDAALAPCAGRWIAPQPRTIVHRGCDHVLEIARERDRWTIRFDVVFDPGVVQRGPRTYTRGETRELTARGGRLVFDAPFAGGGAREVAWTYRVDGERLVAPAWLRRDERTWEYSDSSERLTLRTEHSPEVLATGSATIEGLPTAPEAAAAPITYLAFVRESRAVNAHDTSVVSFSQPDPRGGVRELGELCRTPTAGTWFKHHATTIGEEHWKRLSDADWSAIVALQRGDEPPPR